jgi:hypothetical protein
MSRRWLGPVIFVAVIALLAGGGYWLSRPTSVAAEQPAAPKAAPATGSCWTVDAAAAEAALPWPGSPVDCAAPHTAEVMLVARVDPALVDQAANAEGDDRRLAENLMYAQARRACSAHAGAYVGGGGWRAARTRVVASWVRPQKYGYFGCAIAETADPGGTQLVSRTGSLRGQGAQLGIACVERTGDGALRYVGCDAPHNGEFVGTYTITPLDAPFHEAAVRSAALKGCGGAGLSHLGLPPDGTRPDLRAAYVGPTTAADWLGSDQTFACYLMAEGKLRGSVKGIAGAPLPRG